MEWGKLIQHDWYPHGRHGVRADCDGSRAWSQELQAKQHRRLPANGQRLGWGLEGPRSGRPWREDGHQQIRVCRVPGILEFQWSREVSLSVPRLYNSVDRTSRRGGEPVSSNCDLHFIWSVQKSKLPNTQGSRTENPLGFMHRPHLHSLDDLSVLMENVFNWHFSQVLHCVSSNNWFFLSIY